MKKRRVWRYTCEFCKKSNCSCVSIRLHESRCFKNPSRHCPICEKQWPIPALIEPMKALEDVTEATEPALIKSISEVVDDCPACTLAAIMQTPLPVHEWENEFGESGQSKYWVKWNYKAARDDYLSEQLSRDNLYY